MLKALEQFKSALTPQDLAWLQTYSRQAQQSPPADARPWFLGEPLQLWSGMHPGAELGTGCPTGYFKRGHAEILKSLGMPLRSLRGASCQGPVPGPVGDFTHGFCWDTPQANEPSRSAALALWASQLHSAGHVQSWRNELFGFWPEGATWQGAQPPDPRVPHAFRMERACFRFFGLKSHAVHINGFRADGHMWCGRRTLTKATDPGKLDNLAAGGLPAGETVQLCGIREMAEEAGLQAGLAEQAIACGEVTTNRMEPEGWHHEALWVYNLAMPMDVLPQNQDGEVSEFLCMSPHEVMAALRQQAFSVDAGCVIAQGVLGSDIALQSP